MLMHTYVSIYTPMHIPTNIVCYKKIKIKKKEFYSPKLKGSIVRLYIARNYRIHLVVP